MQPGTGHRTGTCNIAGILRNLGLNQYNIQLIHMFTPLYHIRAGNATVFCRIQTFFLPARSIYIPLARKFPRYPTVDIVYYSAKAAALQVFLCAGMASAQKAAPGRYRRQEYNYFTVSGFF